MTQKKLRKVLLMTCCALALVAVSVGATLAYLTDTEAVTNTFTVGQVDLTLDEAKVDGNGKEITGKDAERVQANEYKLLPGMTYDKDPTIHLTANTAEKPDYYYQDAYVVAKVTVSKGTELLSLLPADLGTIGIKNIVTGGVLNNAYVKNETENKWSYTDADGVKQITLTQEYDEENNSIIFMIYWEKPQMPGTNLVIFEELHIPSEWDNDEIAKLEDMEIKVTAYAIQAAGFDDVETAFAAGDWND